MTEDNDYGSHLKWGVMEWVVAAVVLTVVIAFAGWKRLGFMHALSEQQNVSYTVSIDHPSPDSVVPPVFVCRVSRLQAVEQGDIVTVRFSSEWSKAIGAVVMSGGEERVRVMCNGSAYIGECGIVSVEHTRPGSSQFGPNIGSARSVTISAQATANDAYCLVYRR